MKKDFSRRNFLQTAAVGAAATVIPNIAEAADKKKKNAPQNIKSEMPQRRLGRTNRMVSAIGFGGGSRYCNWVADERQHQRFIDYAIELGITYWDSARAYGNGLCEERFGKYLTPKYRNQIFLNGKSGARTYDGVMKDIEISLTNMKTDHLDMYCMHGLDQVKDVDELLNTATGGYKAFLKLKSEGIIKHVGFSYHKWNEASQKAFEVFDVDAVLCPINASRYTGNEENMIPVALKKDIGIIAIKILGQNALIGNVTGNDLIRYSLSLPISVANVGLDGWPSLEATAAVGKEPVLSREEAEEIHKKLEFDPKKVRLPYFVG